MTLSPLSTLFLFLLITLAFCASTVHAGWVCPHLPIPSGGGNCGPEIGGVDIGYSKVKMTAYNWFKTKTKEADFRSACSTHDDCYEEAKQLSGSTCRAKIDSCNDDFKDDMYAECSASSSWKSCHRSQCRDVADFFSGLVDTAATAYKIANC
mmetsp:Transcript_1891/g.3901  ORF Transcript_1891/g.3901 Transcript_1891/m.3901 type:complete len:152 (-) Transcript_1891:104-559(-)|eukprot:CAMPEP_0168765092 /NCGR_PEP_ID=MMETSP0725-20121227/144_1 /TAXON_ID=265536 /ORGANISM="Amphiprora sp., Strain CCMP467" /LENGTH=151 /DNA_ID=CAMNT_0008814331 /DNA_START=136 /DNA_END=591 /DNA_ORIENTATION=-